MEITIDKRIELLTVIQTLDKYWDKLSKKYTNETLFQCKYKENIWDYFGNYINNGMVQLHNKICINFEQIDALMELVLCYSDPPKLENTADLKTNARYIFEQNFPLEEFIKGLRQFYLETDFENFIKNNQEEYEKYWMILDTKKRYWTLLTNI